MTSYDDDRPEIDYRFSMANERTFLAWIRTAVALLVGGLVAAKAITFDHDVLRWVIAVPPIVAGAVLAADAPGRWRRYEDAMGARHALPVGHRTAIVGFGLAVYALIALAAVALDG
jgi:putative membrane protein